VLGRQGEGLAGVRILADQAVQLAAELNQARKEVAPEAKRREVIPRHLRADRLARAGGQAIVWRAEAAELRQRVDAATAKSAALLCQTRRQKKEMAGLNDRIAQLNEDVERGRLDQGILSGEVAARRRAGERVEERLKAMAQHIEALRDSSHATRLLVDHQRDVEIWGSRWLTSSWSWTARRRNWRIGGRS
jgi:chromosome segregation ATPase